jgi:orotate phosphoribosyltransferase
MQDELIRLLAGRRGHFEMESGYHSELWFNLDVLFTRPDQLAPFVGELAQRVRAHRIDAVCGPMTGGAKLAAQIGHELGIASFITERFESPHSGKLYPISYKLPAAQREAVRGKAVAIVDDAISAGSAARGTYADLIACGARPVVLGSLFLVGEAIAPFAAENKLAVEAIARVAFGMWKPADCPLCAAGVAVEKVCDAVA